MVSKAEKRKQKQTNKQKEAGYKKSLHNKFTRGFKDSFGMTWNTNSLGTRQRVLKREGECKEKVDKLKGCFRSFSSTSL